MGAVAVGVGLAAALKHVGLGRLDRWGYAIVVGSLTAPVLGASLLSPTLGVMSGIAATALLVAERVRGEQPSAPPASTPVRDDSVSPVVRSAVVTLCWLSFALGAASMILAFSGPVWPGLSLDGTQAMQLGIAGGFLSALVLGLALTRLAVSRYPGRGIGLSLALGAGLFGLAIAAATSLPLFDAASPIRWSGVLAAVACSAAAVATVAYRLIRGTRGLRWGTALAVGSGYAVTFGVFVTFAAAFLAPVGALILAVSISRRSRVHRQRTLAQS